MLIFDHLMQFLYEKCGRVDRNAVSEKQTINFIAKELYQTSITDNSGDDIDGNDDGICGLRAWIFFQK